MVSATTTRLTLSSIIYDDAQRNGIICLTVASLVSLCAAFFLLAFKTPKPWMYKKTHLFGYLSSLMLADTIQSAGILINFRWVSLGGVSQSATCELQGVLIQFGNLAVAFWSATIAIHLFGLLFFRIASSKRAFLLVTGLGWTLVVLMVIMGPTVMNKSEKGAFYGISGTWCRTHAPYREERIYLEHFPELLAVTVIFFLGTLVLLRARGHVVRSNGKWRFRRSSVDEELSVDHMESSMAAKFAGRLVWLPLCYAILLLPVSIARLAQLLGHSVPFGVVTFTAILFNLTGLAKTIVLIVAQRCLPDLGSSDLPQFVNATPGRDWEKLPHTPLISARGMTFLPPFNARPEKYQYQGPDNTPFFIALPQPVHVHAKPGVRTNNLPAGPSRYRSPEDESGRGKHLF